MLINKGHDLITYFSFLQIFYGNINTYEIEKTTLNPSFIAEKIRFIPYNRKPKTICMRVEVLGCNYTGKHCLKKFELKK